MKLIWHCILMLSNANKQALEIFFASHIYKWSGNCDPNVVSVGHASYTTKLNKTDFYSTGSHIQFFQIQIFGISKIIVNLLVFTPQMSCCWNKWQDFFFFLFFVVCGSGIFSLCNILCHNCKTEECRLVIIFWCHVQLYAILGHALSEISIGE